MEKSKKLVNVLHILATVSFIFSLVVTALLFAGLIVSQFIELPALSSEFFNSSFIFDNTFKFNLSFVEGGDLRPVFNRVMITGVLALGYLSGASYLLKLILANVKADNVFVEENSKYIKYFGYSLIVFSAIMSGMRFFVASAIMNVIDFPGGHFGANFGFDFQTIFIGLIIVLLSQIFAYGTHLQNEYDATV